MSASPSSSVVAPPTTVNVAFWLFMVVALAHVVGIVIAIASFGSAESAAKSQLSGQNTGGVDVNGLVAASLTVAIVIGILYVIAFVLFAVFMRRGANWARIVLLIVTILSLTGVLGQYGVGAVGVVAGVVAVILTFLPAANAYFRATRDRKRGIATA